MIQFFTWVYEVKENTPLKRFAVDALALTSKGQLEMWMGSLPEGMVEDVAVTLNSRFNLVLQTGMIMPFRAADYYVEKLKEGKR